MNERLRSERATIGGPRRLPGWRNGARIGATLLLALALVLAAPLAATARLAALSGTAASAPITQYALIVNGDDSFTHNYNVELALGSLRQLGYDPRNVLVLAPPAAGGSGAADAGAGP